MPDSSEAADLWKTDNDKLAAPCLFCGISHKTCGWFGKVRTMVESERFLDACGGFAPAARKPAGVLYDNQVEQMRRTMHKRIELAAPVGESSKGRTPAFEAENEGSIPSSPGPVTSAFRAAGSFAVNLGAGGRPVDMPGYRNHDLVPGNRIDDVFDLDGPWPYPAATVSDLRASHVLEHVRYPVHFLREAARVLKPGGHLFIRVPHGRHDAGGWDLTHLHRFFPETFHEFVPGVDKRTYNPQHSAEQEWPACWWIDEIYITAADDVQRWPAWRFLTGLLGKYLWGVYTEVWVNMHRLSDADAREVALKPRLNVPVRVVTMSEMLKQNGEMKCTWRAK